MGEMQTRVEVLHDVRQICSKETRELRKYPMALALIPSMRRAQIEVAFAQQFMGVGRSQLPQAVNALAGAYRAVTITHQTHRWVGNGLGACEVVWRVRSMIPAQSAGSTAF